MVIELHRRITQSRSVFHCELGVVNQGFAGIVIVALQRYFCAILHGNGGGTGNLIIITAKGDIAFRLDGTTGGFHLRIRGKDFTFLNRQAAAAHRDGQVVTGFGIRAHILNSANRGCMILIHNMVVAVIQRTGLATFCKMQFVAILGNHGVITHNQRTVAFILHYGDNRIAIAQVAVVTFLTIDAHAGIPFARLFIQVAGIVGTVQGQRALVLNTGGGQHGGYTVISTDSSINTILDCHTAITQSVIAAQCYIGGVISTISVSDYSTTFVAVVAGNRHIAANCHLCVACDIRADFSAIFHLYRTFTSQRAGYIESIVLHRQLQSLGIPHKRIQPLIGQSTRSVIPREGGGSHQLDGQCGFLGNRLQIIGIKAQGHIHRAADAGRTNSTTEHALLCSGCVHQRIEGQR